MRFSPISAAAASVYSNNLTFGTLPSTAVYMRASVASLLKGATTCDLVPECRDECVRRHLAGDGTCAGSLRVGLIQEDDLFPKAMCATAKSELSALGVSAMTDANGDPFLVTLTKPAEFGYADASYLASTRDALDSLRVSGVTAIISCTYYTSARAIVQSLHDMDYSPLATVVTVALSDTRWEVAVGNGWWEGEYALEPVAWHASLPSVGDFSQMTSAQFAQRYYDRYGTHVSFIGASQFAALCVLADAIERAQSLETSAVTAALRQTR